MTAIKNLSKAISKNPTLIGLITTLNLQLEDKEDECDYNLKFINDDTGEILTSENINFLNQNPERDKIRTTNKMVDFKSKLKNAEKNPANDSKNFLDDFEEQEIPDYESKSENNYDFFDLEKEENFVGEFLRIEKLKDGKFSKFPINFCVFKTNAGAEIYIKAWTQLYSYFKDAEINKIYFIQYEGKKKLESGNEMNVVKIMKKKELK